MNPIQTFIPGLPVGPIDAALETIRGSALQHHNYSLFIREVAAAALGHRQGAVILCAAPADISCDEIIVSVSDELRARCAQSEMTPFQGVRIVNTPSGLRRGTGPRGLLSSYHHPIERPGTTHRFQLQMGDSWITRDEFTLVSSELQHAAPTACIFRNIHALQTARADLDGVIDALLMLVEIAHQSSSTHILIGHTSVVLEWLKRPEVARVVTPCVLLPYQRGDATDMSNFEAVVRSYDEIIPWHDDNLAAHLGDIDQVVAGSPHRLRRWLVEALCKAKAENEDHLDWARLVSKQPRKVERNEAWNEREAVRVFLEEGDDSAQKGPSADDSASDKTAPVKRSTPPGIRKPNRNPIAA